MVKKCKTKEPTLAPQYSSTRVLEYQRLLLYIIYIITHGRTTGVDINYPIRTVYESGTAVKNQSESEKSEWIRERIKKKQSENENARYRYNCRSYKRTRVLEYSSRAYS